MQEAVYEFHLSHCGSELLPQVSRALEKRLELFSRQKLPRLWKLTDRLREAHPAPDAPSPTGRVRGIVFLVLGGLLIITGLMQPQQLAGVLVGGVVAALWGIRRIVASLPRTSRFDREASQLLAARNSATETGRARVGFSDRGILVEREGTARQQISYQALSGVLETPDLYLLDCEGRGILLLKQELQGGDTGGFQQFLSRQTDRYGVTG